MNTKSGRIFTAEDVKTSHLAEKTIAVIGYGNQGRAQALNLRDRGHKVIIGNRRDDYQRRAIADGFEATPIEQAVSSSQVVLLLVPDEILPDLYRETIEPSLQAGSMLVFASGYCLAFDQVQVGRDLDIALLAPRMIGVGVRERYLTKEGFYCFVSVQQDASGQAWELLLELTESISGFHKPAIEVSFKQEAILDLFNEQAFGPAFGRVLLTSIQVLLEKGLPPEAVLVEMYMSEEMAYTYRKMAQTGLVRQTYFHSQTSQYGAMSRGIRFIRLGLKDIMRNIYHEIESGAFAREWSGALSPLKLKAIRAFATRQRINRVEREVRQSLGIATGTEETPEPELAEILNDPRIRAEMEAFEGMFEF